MIPVEVVGVRVEMPSNQPIVLLKEIEGARFLPIWVGAVEATAIAFAQQEVLPPRPLTHDLMVNLLNLLHAKIEKHRRPAGRLGHTPTVDRSDTELTQIGLDHRRGRGGAAGINSV